MADKQRLALELRRLALECAEGTAPQFGRMALFSHADGSPVCALGHAMHRAGWRAKRHPIILYEVNQSIVFAVTSRTNDAITDHEERQIELVLPLFALAEALEAA